jgi:hypothetical protein
MVPAHRALVLYDPTFAAEQMKNWSGYPINQGTVYVLSNGIAFTQTQWQAIGTSDLVGEFSVVNLDQESILSQIPSNFQIIPQQRGEGVVFRSPSIMTQLRVHGPSRASGLDPQSPSALGWVARIERYDPGNILAPKSGLSQGWVSYNAYGFPVPAQTNAAHIPIFGNPAQYTPWPTQAEWNKFIQLLTNP